MKADQFPAEYKGDAFVALHGSWNSAKPTGYKVVRIRFKDGKPVGGYENFLTGFRLGDTSPAQVWGRPVGLAVAKDGSLLVTDDAGKGDLAGGLYGESGSTVGSPARREPGLLSYAKASEDTLRCLPPGGLPPEAARSRQSTYAKRLRWTPSSAAAQRRVVELSGIEPLASSLRTRRSPN